MTKFQTVIRVNHNQQNPFVQLSKSTLWDDRLSLKAIGLWSRCLSRPDDWSFNISELVAKCKEGRRSVESAMRELMEVGLVCRFEHSTRCNGKFTGSIVQYMIFETPVSKEDKDKHEKEFKKFYRDCGFGDVRHGDVRNVELPKTETPTKTEVFEVNDRKPSLTCSISNKKRSVFSSFSKEAGYRGKAKYTDSQRASLEWLKLQGIDTGEDTLSWWARKHPLERLQDVYREAKKRSRKSVGAYMQTLLQKDSVVPTSRTEQNKEFAQDFKTANRWYDLEIFDKYAKFYVGDCAVELDFNREPMDFAQYMMEKHSQKG